jgi:prepilin-type N-terminal cleavage/methylation domain-containing protein
MIMMNKGFTLLEIIIVIFIILITIVAIAGLAWQNLSTINLNYSRLTAAYLAQEGMEIMRNGRDQEWLDNRVAGNSTIGYTLEDYGDYCCDINDYNKSEDFELYIDSNGYYVCGSGVEQSKFTRKVTIGEGRDFISHVCSKIEIVVSWTERGRDYNITTSQDLCDWMEHYE